MKIPKKWRGAEGNLHHFVNEFTESLHGEQVIVSKTWRPRYQCWNYHAAKRREVESLLQFNKAWRKKP